MTDKINVDFRNGYYHIDITRRIGNSNPSIIMIKHKPNILELALGLIKFDAECIADLGTSNPSSKTSNYRYCLNEWELNFKHKMFADEEALLTNLVTGHNRYREAINRLYDKQIELTLSTS